MTLGCNLLAGEPVPLGGEFRCECLGEFRVHHLLGQNGKYPGLEHFALNSGAVVAQSSCGGVAAVSAGAERREGPLAGAAEDLAAEQMAGPPLFPEALAPGFPILRRSAGQQSRLHCGPELIVDDPKLGHQPDDARLGWVEPPMRFARHGVDDTLATVPDQLADVVPVAEDAVAMAGAAAKGHGAPAHSLGGRHAFLVQHAGDGGGRQALSETPEDALNDNDLLRHDLAQSALELAVRA
jgi:hypothetical protein